MRRLTERRHADDVEVEEIVAMRSVGAYVWVRLWPLAVAMVRVVGWNKRRDTELWSQELAWLTGDKCAYHVAARIELKKKRSSTERQFGR